MFNFVNINRYFFLINKKKIFSYYKWNLFFFKFIKLKFIKKKLKFFNKITFKYFSLKTKNTFFFKRKTKNLRPYSYFKFSIIKYTRKIVHKHWYYINNYLKYVNYNLHLFNLYSIKLQNIIYIWRTIQSNRSLFINKKIIKIKKFKFLEKKIMFWMYMFNYVYFIKFYFMLSNKKLKKKIAKLRSKIIFALYKRIKFKRYYSRKYKSKLFFKNKKYNLIFISKHKHKRKYKYKFKRIKNKKNNKIKKLKWYRAYKKNSYRMIITYRKYRNKFLKSKKKLIKRTIKITTLYNHNKLTDYSVFNKFNFRSSWLDRNVLFLKRYFNTYNYKTKLWRIII